MTLHIFLHCNAYFCIFALQLLFSLQPTLHFCAFQFASPLKFWLNWQISSEQQKHAITRLPSDKEALPSHFFEKSKKKNCFLSNCKALNMKKVKLRKKALESTFVFLSNHAALNTKNQLFFSNWKVLNMKKADFFSSNHKALNIKKELCFFNQTSASARKVWNCIRAQACA